MIAYDLQCGNGHLFEGWFDDSRAFQTQLKKGLVTCPVCNDASISRLPSTFSIRSSEAGPAQPQPQPQPQPRSDLDVEKIQGQIIDFVEKNFDNVGSDFAKEALKMHYGVSAPRNIRGSSTDQEEETLRKEGIEFIKLPLPVRPEPDA
ncbi:MAG: DUF1178 family protein [Desulfobacterales bacterium]|jgi:hypothetical protein